MIKTIDTDPPGVETTSPTTCNGMSLAIRFRLALTDQARACDLNPQIQGCGTNILTAAWALEDQGRKGLVLVEEGDIL